MFETEILIIRHVLRTSRQRYRTVWSGRAFRSARVCWPLRKHSLAHVQPAYRPGRTIEEAVETIGLLRAQFDPDFAPSWQAPLPPRAKGAADRRPRTDTAVRTSDV